MGPISNLKMSLESDVSAVSAAGNTKSQRLRSRVWFFTYNIGTNPITCDDVSHCLDTLDARTYVFQLERGSDGDNLHYQGAVQFKNQVSFSTLKQHHGSIHWERCANYDKAKRYCTKEETRVSGPWSKGLNLPKPISLIPIDSYNAFQTHVIGLAGECVNDRTIYWFWERSGGVGKTALSKILAIRYGALVVSGKASDIKYAVSKYIDSGKELKVVVFHFVRSVENFVSYDAIESIKDGLFFNSKYECNMYVFNSPHIFCFANFEPDYDKLSEDRWVVKNISKDL